MTDQTVSRTTDRVPPQHSYFFPSSVGPPPSGGRMISVREVTESATAYYARLKESERERVARRTEQAVADNAAPDAAARAIADVVSEATAQDPRSLAAAHRVAVETVADVAPERAGAITSALSGQLAGAYAGASTSTLDTAA